MTLVLVVSDDHERLRSLTRVLNTQGFATIGVLSRHQRAVMRYLHCDEPHVVLLDGADGPRDRCRLLRTVAAVSTRPSVVCVVPAGSPTAEMTATHGRAAVAGISRSAGTRELKACLRASARFSGKAASQATS